MDRAALSEMAKTDPIYAAAYGAGKLEEMDDDRLYIEIGRAVMAIAALERRGWAVVRADAAKTVPPSCDPHFGVPT